MTSPLYPLSSADAAAIELAYAVLTRLGNRHPGDGPGGWNELLDRAQQALGAMQALHVGAGGWLLADGLRAAGSPMIGSTADEVLGGPAESLVGVVQVRLAIEMLELAQAAAADGTAERERTILHEALGRALPLLRDAALPTADDVELAGRFFDQTQGGPLLRSGVPAEQVQVMRAQYVRDVHRSAPAVAQLRQWGREQDAAGAGG